VGRKSAEHQKGNWGLSPGGVVIIGPLTIKRKTRGEKVRWTKRKGP